MCWYAYQRIMYDFYVVSCDCWWFVGDEQRSCLSTVGVNMIWAAVGNGFRLLNFVKIHVQRHEAIVVVE